MYNKQQCTGRSVRMKAVVWMDLFDLIGPVMIGPSSSHTAGAARIGLTARMLLGEKVVSAQIGFHGSFAKTYRGHGTDRAIVGGIMGMQVDDLRLRNSLELAAQEGLELTFTMLNIRGAHPNTVRLTVQGVSGRKLTMEAASVGGGNIEVHRLDGMAVSFTGKEHTLIIHHNDVPGQVAAVSGIMAQRHINIGTMAVYRHGAGGDAMMVFELDSELNEDMLDAIRRINGVQSATFLKRRAC